MVEFGQLFLKRRTAIGNFVDFAEVKERCSIVDAVALLGLKTSEERNQLRAACPACGDGGPRPSSLHRQKASSTAFRRKPEGIKLPSSATSKA
jgi:hypothetical protein